MRKKFSWFPRSPLVCLSLLYCMLLLLPFHILILHLKSVFSFVLFFLFLPHPSTFFSLVLLFPFLLTSSYYLPFFLCLCLLLHIFRLSPPLCCSWLRSWQRTTQPSEQPPCGLLAESWTRTVYPILYSAVHVVLTEPLWKHTDRSTAGGCQ